MSTFLKVLVGLLLTLPLGAYVAGTLVASQADIPDERDVVVVESSTTQGPSTAQPSGTPSGRPDDDRTDRPDDKGGVRDHDRNDDKGGDRDDDDDADVRVIRPTPHDVDDDGDDDADDRDDDTDDD